MSHLPVPVRVTSAAPWPKVAPLSAESYALQMTIRGSTHEKLRYAQALLGHAAPSGDPSVRAATEKREKAAADAEAAAAEQDPERSVVPWLRQLGYRLADAREAASMCKHMPDATLEERIKAALRYFHPKTASRPANGLGTAV